MQRCREHVVAAGTGFLCPGLLGKGVPQFPKLLVGGCVELRGIRRKSKQLWVLAGKHTGARLGAEPAEDGEVQVSCAAAGTGGNGHQQDSWPGRGGQGHSQATRSLSVGIYCPSNPQCLQ